jgi:mannose-1-phosphate guanylyltransferase
MRSIAVIMAGGSGERFWPLSRIQRPKQLLKLTHPDKSLLQEAVDRIEPLVGNENVFVITAPHLQAPIVGESILPSSNVWAEPMKRNTLGALAWVAAQLLAQDERDVVLAVLTADHKIADEEAFREAVQLALETAEETGALVTCGITPTRPETGYGYIEVDESEQTSKGALRSKGFREKPDFETAVKMVEAGRFLWNSGMFFYTLEGFLRELGTAHPEARQIIDEIAVGLKAGDEAAAEQAFAKLPNLSIDYALAEKAQTIYVVQAGFGWDDVGAWDALSRSMGIADDVGNVQLGNVLAVDTKNAVLYNESNLKLAVVGMEDVIAVATNDAILICPKDKAQRVKEIVEALKAEASPLL